MSKKFITGLACLAFFSVTGCKPNPSETNNNAVTQQSTANSTINKDAHNTNTSIQGIVLEEGWAKATVVGQEASGGYLRIRSDQALRLLGGSSPAAQAVEVHEMRMEGEVMRMRALEFLDIPANTTVELAPGGNHLMLLGLKAPLQAGSTVPITLRLATSDGKILELPSTLQVRSPAQDQHQGHNQNEHEHSEHQHSNHKH